MLVEPFLPFSQFYTASFGAYTPLAFALETQARLPLGPAFLVTGKSNDAADFA